MEYPLGVEFRYALEPLIIEVEQVFSEEECAQYIDFIEESAPRLATNNAIYRDQDRAMKDDPVLASKLFSKINQSLPSQLGEFELSRINERFRFYRYNPGQKFPPHMDHWYQANDNEISLYSILIYLNSGFSGGQTRFMEQIEKTVVPEVGKAAVFQHKIRHEGCEVVSGTKYAVRTDIMYKKI